MMTAAEHAYWDAQWAINVFEDGRRRAESKPVEDLLDVLLQWPKPVPIANKTGGTSFVGTGTSV